MWLIREADGRGMVVQVGLISPQKDQTFLDEAAIQRGIQETGRLLTQHQLKNVFVDWFMSMVIPTESITTSCRAGSRGQEGQVDEVVQGCCTRH